jgi:hypothetical protein
MTGPSSSRPPREGRLGGSTRARQGAPPYKLLIFWDFIPRPAAASVLLEISRGPVR